MMVPTGGMGVPLPGGNAAGVATLLPAGMAQNSVPVGGLMQPGQLACWPPGMIAPGGAPGLLPGVPGMPGMHGISVGMVHGGLASMAPGIAGSSVLAAVGGLPGGASAIGERSKKRNAKSRGKESKRDRDRGGKHTKEKEKGKANNIDREKGKTKSKNRHLDKEKEKGRQTKKQNKKQKLKVKVKGKEQGKESNAQKGSGKDRRKEKRRLSRQKHRRRESPSDSSDTSSSSSSSSSMNVKQKEKLRPRSESKSSYDDEESGSPDASSTGKVARNVYDSRGEAGVIPSKGFSPAMASPAEAPAIGIPAKGFSTALPCPAGATANSSTPANEAASGWSMESQAHGFQKLEKLDVLQLPRALIGRILGKEDATIRDIRARSGARVDAKDQDEDPVQVQISGSNEAVECARSMLLDVAEGAAIAIGGDGAPNEVSSLVRGAESGAEHQKECVSGTADNLQKVATDTSPTLASGSGSANGVCVDTAPLPPMVEEYVDLPRTATGKVIGTRGQQIAEVRQKSGAQVDVDKSPSGCRVRVVGSREQADAAIVLIKQILEPVGGQDETIGIPRNAVGRIIGAGGSRIQELQEKSGAKIDIDRTTEQCHVRFSGTAEAIASAKAMVVEILEGRDRPSPNENLQTMEIPSSFTGRLIGPGGTQINDIQKRSGAKVDIDKSKEPCIVRMTGSAEAVAAAEVMIREVMHASSSVPKLLALQGLSGAAGAGLGSQLPGPGFPVIGGSIAPLLALPPPKRGELLDEETIKFDIPLAIADRVLSGGTWPRVVEQKTGARIVVLRDASSCRLEMSGQPEQVIEAEQMAEDAVKCINTLVAAGSIASAATAAAPRPVAALPGPTGGGSNAASMTAPMIASPMQTLAEAAVPIGSAASAPSVLPLPSPPPMSAPGATVVRRPPVSHPPLTAPLPMATSPVGVQALGGSPPIAEVSLVPCSNSLTLQDGAVAAAKLESLLRSALRPPAPQSLPVHGEGSLPRSVFVAAPEVSPPVPPLGLAPDFGPSPSLATIPNQQGPPPQAFSGGSDVSGGLFWDMGPGRPDRPVRPSVARAMDAAAAAAAATSALAGCGVTLPVLGGSMCPLPGSTGGSPWADVPVTSQATVPSSPQWQTTAPQLLATTGPSPVWQAPTPEASLPGACSLVRPPASVLG